MSAPDKIWVITDDNQDGCCPVETDLDDVGKFFDAARAVEYVRTDLTPPAADYVAGLEAAAENVRDWIGDDPIGGLTEALAARPASPDTRVVHHGGATGGGTGC
jgi:hypothetical protein